MFLFTVCHTAQHWKLFWLAQDQCRKKLIFLKSFIISIPYGSLYPCCRKRWPDFGQNLWWYSRLCMMFLPHGCHRKSSDKTPACIILLSPSCCCVQAKGSVGAGQSAHATRCPTSRTVGGGWPLRMPGKPAGWMEASCSALKQKASSDW